MQKIRWTQDTSLSSLGYIDCRKSWAITQWRQSQWRNHARAITGSSRVEIISTRAVANPGNEQDVLCLSIKPNDFFRFKTEI